jgi:MFS-type transporter involved in bile tolerance (Atg22 family)
MIILCVCVLPALLAIGVCALSWAYKALISCVVLMGLLFELHRLFYPAVTVIALHNNEWQFQSEGGWQSATLADGSVVTGLITVLRLKDLAGHIHAIHLLPDSADAELVRRLRRHLLSVAKT